MHGEEEEQEEELGQVGRSTWDLKQTRKVQPHIGDFLRGGQIGGHGIRRMFGSRQAVLTAPQSERAAVWSCRRSTQ